MVFFFSALSFVAFDLIFPYLLESFPLRVSIYKFLIMEKRWVRLEAEVSCKFPTATFTKSREQIHWKHDFDPEVKVDVSSYYKCQYTKSKRQTGEYRNLNLIAQSYKEAQKYGVGRDEGIKSRKKNPVGISSRRRSSFRIDSVFFSLPSPRSRDVSIVFSNQP